MTDERLNKIYDKTHGCCHICHKKLSFSNYALHGTKGCWEVEHSVAKAKGGSDRLNNLYPACILCNRSKGVLSTRTVRKYNGKTRAPYSKAKKDMIKNDNMLGVGSLGFAIGAGLGGPLGGVIGAIIGSEIGKNMSVKK
ncbi:MAG: HNH endonuclease [Mucilaginibacter sp.]